MTPEIKAALGEAMEHAPEGYGIGEGTPMLPRRRHSGRCRLCGETALLTEEHVPPRNSGNKGQYRSFTFQDWLDRASGGLDLGAGIKGQGGISGYTLCERCNSRTGGEYGSEYQGWAAFASDLLAQLPLEDQSEKVAPYYMSFEVEPVSPGRFVRQVLSMFASVSGDWWITDRMPEIRSIVLDGATAALPETVAIGLSFCAGPRARIVGPQLILNTGSLAWGWLMEVAHPPLAVSMLIVGSSGYELPGIDIGSFTLEPIDREVRFQAEAQVGFTYSPYLLDYRSAAALGASAPTPEGFSNQ
jgi:hypothetical protein